MNWICLLNMCNWITYWSLSGCPSAILLSAISSKSFNFSSCTSNVFSKSSWRLNKVSTSSTVSFWKKKIYISIIKDFFLSMSYEHYKKILILHNVCTHPKISIVQELFMATGHRVYIVSLLIEKLQQKRDPSSNLVILR